MKKYLIVLMILLLAPIAYASSNLVTESAPVYPGDTTYVYVPIKNLGYGTDLYDVSVKLVPTDAASTNAVTILNDVDTLGTIDKWGAERTAKFRIHVNSDTVEGNYYFDVYVSSRGKDNSGGYTTLSTTKLEDRVLTIKGIPKIMLLNSTLGIIEPMSINRETLTFKNEGTGTLENAVVEINLVNDKMKSVFSLIGGGTKFSIGNLKVGNEVNVTFDMAVDIAALPGVYNLPVKITGQNNYSSTDYIGLIVAGTTDFEISYQETMGSFSLNVANIGVNPASAVTVSIPHQNNYSVAGSSTSVLGNLNPGDYTSAIFKVLKTGTGKTLKVDIQYTDTSGKRHTDTKALNVDISSARAQTGTSRSTGSTSLTTYLLVLIAVVIGYWQRRKIFPFYHKLTRRKT